MLTVSYEDGVIAMSLLGVLGAIPKGVIEEEDAHWNQVAKQQQIQQQEQMFPLQKQEAELGLEYRRQQMQEQRAKMAAASGFGAFMGPGGAPSPSSYTGAAGGASAMPSDAYENRLIQVESGGNPLARTGSNYGLGQFGPSEQKRYGITDWRNPVQQHMAIQKERGDIDRTLSRAGVEHPSPGQEYFLHQQGMAGGPALMSPMNANRPAWEVLTPFYKNPHVALSAISGNIPPNMKGMDPRTITAQQFTQGWVHWFEQGGALRGQRNPFMAGIPPQTSSPVRPQMAPMAPGGPPPMQGPGGQPMPQPPQGMPPQGMPPQGAPQPQGGPVPINFGPAPQSSPMALPAPPAGPQAQPGVPPTAGPVQGAVAMPQQPGQTIMQKGAMLPQGAKMPDRLTPGQPQQPQSPGDAFRADIEQRINGEMQKYAQALQAQGIQPGTPEFGMAMKQGYDMILDKYDRVYKIAQEQAHITHEENQARHQQAQERYWDESIGAKSEATRERGREADQRDATQRAKIEASREIEVARERNKEDLELLRQQGSTDRAEMTDRTKRAQLEERTLHDRAIEQLRRDTNLSTADYRKAVEEETVRHHDNMLALGYASIGSKEKIAEGREQGATSRKQMDIDARKANNEFSWNMRSVLEDKRQAGAMERTQVTEAGKDRRTQSTLDVRREEGQATRLSKLELQQNQQMWGSEEKELDRAARKENLKDSFDWKTGERLGKQSFQHSEAQQRRDWQADRLEEKFAFEADQKQLSRDALERWHGYIANHQRLTDEQKQTMIDDLLRHRRITEDLSMQYHADLQWYRQNSIDYRNMSHADNMKMQNQRQETAIARMHEAAQSKDKQLLVNMYDTRVNEIARDQLSSSQDRNHRIQALDAEFPGIRAIRDANQPNSPQSQVVGMASNMLGKPFKGATEQERNSIKNKRIQLQDGSVWHYAGEGKFKQGEPSSSWW